ncbi:MAG: hypothetical protein P8N02_18655 [Actinomycetota bacterium]|nr:hypothetical protein [Actinomycetota bacterium]
MVCNTYEILAFLDEDEKRGVAWARVNDVDPTEIDDYIDGLTPAILLLDTRVSNHGYRDGEAAPFQAVLEKGTAILVDAAGIPRVRCACGNPLLAPDTQPTDATYTGDAWENFDAREVRVVSPGEPAEAITLHDLASDAMLARPVGTSGESDTRLERTTTASNP